jgi:hypothetical protein
MHIEYSKMLPGASYLVVLSVAGILFFHTSCGGGCCNNKDPTVIIFSSSSFAQQAWKAIMLKQKINHKENDGFKFIVRKDKRGAHYDVLSVQI